MVILMRRFLFALIAALALVSATFAATEDAAPATDASQENLIRATFAGGCFWCMEEAFEQKIEAGVVSVVSGYTGGDVANPTYQQVSAGGTGHAEVVQVLYDPDLVSYEELLHVYWRQINPTTPDRQFCDVGSSYRPAIFYHGEQQRRLAEASRQALAESGRFDKPIVVPIVPAGPFYKAEDYHQNYYKENPVRYNFYAWSCGRYQYLDKVWGKDGH